MADGFAKYLMQLVVEYANSDVGRKTIEKDNGIDLKGTTLTLPKRGRKKKSMPDSELMRYGEEMKQILYAYTNPLIKSITLNDIIVGQPKQDEDGKWSITISFRDGSLSRDSLDDNDYPEGLSNIVLLFAKGYHAKNYVYGLWNTTGNKNAHWAYWKDVHSRKDRSGNDFLIRAVQEFNTKHKTDKIAKAELLGKYKEDSENPV